MMEGDGGGMMSKLPTDILIDILLRVSIKTLSRCIFVCKSWSSIVQNPSFLANYNTNSIHPHSDHNSCVILNRSYELVDCDSQTFHLKLPPLADKLTALQHSSNGLLLLVTRANCYYVCNPITGDHVGVPRSPLSDHCPAVIRFAYDPVSEVCKIIREFKISSYDGVTSKVEVWNLATREWRVMEDEELVVKSLCHSNSSTSGSATGKEDNISLERLYLYDSFDNVFLNGGIHWISKWKISKKKIIISFKLDTDEFYQVPLPVDVNRETSGGSQRMLVVRECLSVVDPVEFDCIVIWVMKDYGLESSWEKKYVVRNIVTDNGDLIQEPYVALEFTQYGEILLLCSRGLELGYYQPVTKAFKFAASVDRSAYFWTPVHHVCSLTSPGSISR